jgi:fucose 4-O-acetylase-like acetyltransferase
MNRHYKLDNIRALAIMAVVLGHSIILYSTSWNLYEPAVECPFLDYLKRLINIFQMPLFFSLSGYLLSAFGCRKEFPKFISVKFIRLIVPFVCVGTLLMIPLKMVLGYAGYTGVEYMTAIRWLFNGTEAGHLWYLPTLFLIFAVSYWVIKCSQQYPAILAVSFVVAVMLHYFRHDIPDFNIPYQYPVFEHLWGFLFGCVIHRFRIDQKFMKYKVLFLVGCIPLAVIEMVSGRIDILASALIVLCIYLWIPDAACDFLTMLSKNSFGIYLLHSPLIYVTFTYFANTHPILVVSMNLFVWGALSLIMTKALRKCALKFLIGE